jgi:hypothetical protein
MAEDDAEAPEVPLDDEARLLLLEQKKAEARKAIVEASTPAVPKIADSLSLGEKGASSLASVEASRGTKLAAGDIAKAVGAIAGVTTVVLVEDRGVAQNDIALTEVQSRLDGLDTTFSSLESVIPAIPAPHAGGTELAPVLALPAILAIANLASGIFGLFRSDYSVSSRDVTPDKLGLIAEVAAGLSGQSKTVILPGFGLVNESALINKFRALVVRRYELERRIAYLDNGKVLPATQELDALRARLAKLEEAADGYFADGSKDDAWKKAQELITTVSAKIKEKSADAALSADRSNVATGRSVLTAFDAAATALTTPPATGYPPLIAAALREKVKMLAAAKGGSPHLLFVDVSSAGADAVTRSSGGLNGARAAFIGGVGVTYFLADAEGRLVSSGTFHRVSASIFDFGQLKTAKVDAWKPPI